ncbi:hypothetical protein BJV82DRAFT_586709 [Fennellomyces sp. T-0311]|nr:hypothetical protein BJV82DRAFT_586709 [Fennellomyces sp. T-0311]
MDQELRFEKTEDGDAPKSWLEVLLTHFPEMTHFIFHPCFKPFSDYWLHFQRCVALAEFPESRAAVEQDLGIMVIELHNLVVTIFQSQPQQYVPEDCESSTPYIIAAVLKLRERVEVMQHTLRFLENGRLLGKDPLTTLVPYLQYITTLCQQQNVTPDTSMQGMQSQFYVNPAALMQPWPEANDLSLIAPIQPLPLPSQPQVQQLPMQSQQQFDIPPIQQQQQFHVLPMQLQQVQLQSMPLQQVQSLPMQLQVQPQQMLPQSMQVESTPEAAVLPLPSPPRSVAQAEIQQLETKHHIPQPETPPDSSSAEEVCDTPMSIDDEDDELDDDNDADYRDDDDHEETEEEVIDEDDEYIEPEAKLASRRRRVPRVKQSSEGAVVKRPRAPRHYTRRTATSYDAETTHYLKSIFFSIYSKRDKLTKDQRRQVQQHTGLKPRNITYWFSNHKRRFQTSLHVFKETVRASNGKIKTYDDFLRWRLDRGLPEEVMESELDNIPAVDSPTSVEDTTESAVSS